MDGVVYILYLFMVAPFLFMMAFLTKKNGYLIVAYIFGVTACLVAAEINTAVKLAMDYETEFFTTTVAPIIEESLKAIPVFVYAAFFSTKTRRLLPFAFSVGIGFAMLENITIFVALGNEATFVWALMRVLGSGLLHGLCTSVIGFGIASLGHYRRIVVPITIGLMSVAETFHGVFNCFVQSEDYKAFGIAMPLLVYVVIVVYQYRNRLLLHTESDAEENRGISE